MIYFAKAEHDTLIKIGTSGCVASRLMALSYEVKSPMILLAAMDGGREVEKEMHNRFADHRVRGEWFTPCQELMDFVLKLPQLDIGGPKPPKARDGIKISIEINDALRKRLKNECARTKRRAIHEAATLIEEALDARERKGARK